MVHSEEIIAVSAVRLFGQFLFECPINWTIYLNML
jgi:hypothetical protein